MKNLIPTLVFIILILIGAFMQIELSRSTGTTLIVKNSSKTDTITAYLTIGCPDTTKWVSNVHNIFGINTTGAQGSFTLAPNQQVSYQSKKAIQGNICFNSPPVNCPEEVTVCEFCLNNKGTVKYAQETIDISCVSGISFISKITLQGTKWTANYKGYDTITVIQNGIKGTNSGRPGVYPFGCDNCTSQSSQAPSCTIGNNEPPQKHNICNVQRNAMLSGGTVMIEYLKKVE